MSYYTVIQSCHGADHKWIFKEETISNDVFDGGPVPDEADIGCWPIGGSNSSDAHIRKVNSEEEVLDFLTAPCDGPDAEDPMLVDLAEYYCSVDTDYGSCTAYFLQRFELVLNSIDYRLEEAQKMIQALQERGYDDFDYSKPFYGANRCMRYSELCEIYEKECDK